MEEIGQSAECDNCHVFGVMDIVNSETNYKNPPTSGTWDYTEKPIEHRISGLGNIVLFASALAGVALLIAGVVIDDNAVTTKILCVASALAVAFSGWVWMLLLKGFAEVIQLNREKVQKN